MSGSEEQKEQYCWVFNVSLLSDTGTFEDHRLKVWQHLSALANTTTNKQISKVVAERGWDRPETLEIYIAHTVHASQLIELGVQRVVFGHHICGHLGTDNYDECDKNHLEHA